LLTDLKQRGLLDSTLVVWGGEFGRMPVSQNGSGRDHNPNGFLQWMAGGGVSHGETDEISYAAAENPVSVNDLHATMLHLLGLDHERLTYFHNGRSYRLTDVAGEVIRPILAQGRNAPFDSNVGRTKRSDFPAMATHVRNIPNWRSFGDALLDPAYSVLACGLPQTVPLHFSTTDHHVMDFIGAVGKSQVSLIGVHRRQWSPLRHTGSSMHLDGPVNDLADLFGNHRFDGTHVDTSFLIPEHIHCFRSLQYHQSTGINFDSGTGHLLQILAKLH